jgi:hypothetical protein
MPRFYINFQNGGQVMRDDVGKDLPGLEEAKAIAIASAREIVADNVKSASDRPLEAVIITDEGGRELVTIPAKDVLPEPMKD